MVCFLSLRNQTCRKNINSMNINSAIEFENVSKKFCIRLEEQMWYGFSDILRNILNMRKTNTLRKDEFWSINKVNFKIKKGESVGIVGLNGSGKSTTLKMINGIFMPDLGKISIRGRVGALIEVGAGFHPYLTGKENIYLSGAIFGMPKKYIDQKFDEIVEFSEIEKFLDMPVKNYSSGMYVRLGFAVAAHMQTDILLIDEIFAVGDVDYQKKCLTKIQELKNIGKTIVFVSHNEKNLKEICSKGILLHEGKMVYRGNIDDVLKKYKEYNLKN